MVGLRGAQGLRARTSTARPPATETARCGWVLRR